MGANFNYFLGYFTGKTLSSEAQVQRYGALGDSVQYRARFDVMSSYSESGSPSGRGIGFDFGVSAKYDKRFQFSLSFTNLLAKITWTDNTEHHVFFKADTVALNDEDDEDTSVEDDSSYAIGSFSTPLPSVMRAGASFQMLDNLTLMAEWQQGFDEYFGNSTTPRVGVAAEYFPISWVPLRGGLAVGGRQGFQFGVGTGLHFTNFEFDLSYGMNNAMWPTASEGMFLAMGMKIQF